MKTDTVKKIIAVLAVLAVAVIVCSAGCVENKQIYVIGIQEYLSPWESINENNQASGASVDVINMIAESVGLNVEYVKITGSIEEEMEKGIIDARSSTVKTPEREAAYLFTESPFEVTRYGAIARDDTDVTIDDVLSGKASIAINKDSAYDSWAKVWFKDYDERVSDGRIVLTENLDDIVMCVLLRRTDSAVAGDISLSDQLNKYPVLKFLGYIGEPVKAGLAFRKDDAEAVKLFNEGVEKVKNTPEFDALVKEYNLQYKKDKYIVGIDDHNAPWSYIGENGEYTGFDIEQVKWIADRNNFDVDFKVCGWGANHNAIISGEIDMWASSMTITPERMNYVAFSDPYYSSGIKVGVKPSSRLTKTDFDSENAKIITFSGTTYVDWLENYLGKEKFDRKIADGSIILAYDTAEYYSMFNSGIVDFAISGSKQIDDEVAKGIMKVVYSEDGFEKFGIAFSNGNIVLQDMINKGLAEFEESGEKAKLMKKYGL